MTGIRSVKSRKYQGGLTRGVILKPYPQEPHAPYTLGAIGASRDCPMPSSTGFGITVFQAGALARVRFSAEHSGSHWVWGDTNGETLAMKKKTSKVVGGIPNRFYSGTKNSPQAFAAARAFPKNEKCLKNVCGRVLDNVGVISSSGHVVRDWLDVMRLRARMWRITPSPC
ncbi:hypothetical protein BJY01DRAFT_104818 [Aspergillus pseudoustus]|uniref:Uncharacterized protein n=1 Tax=Aspergillus pseudoustus TaxID=1810923 RepID=A0ABR4IWJ6_9EURO